MSPNQFSSGHCSSLVRPDENEPWPSQLFPAGHADLPNNLTKQQDTTDSVDIVTAATPQQSYTMSAACNSDFSIPSVPANPHWLAYTTAPSAAFGHFNQPAARQPIEFPQSSDIYAPQQQLSIRNSTQQIGDSLQGLIATSHRPAAQRVHAATPRTDPPRAFICEWRGCTYTGTFSQLAQLRRHVDTQHVNPRSFVCLIPGCDKVFNRKDNLRMHLRQIHECDKWFWESLTGKRETDPGDPSGEWGLE
ncbi:hypothetical protein ASPCAL11370 [Aspergillus calidoustus]|uniref:C2H2-type domain-containing protein n=1 Tax=Aspergillus calidoustus TaxID=454130 RepID=A0A0U5G9E7_ASPCI|nr:hypothetical protein ASPCAL11370 [Aspergillus calidoustus]